MSDAATWYLDADGDGYGDASDSLAACEQPSGYVSDDTDCDDADGDVHPGASEVCDGVDDDCDGSVSWLEDDPDGDGVMACDQALWYRTDGNVNNDPTRAASYGSSEAAALLTAEGVTWSTDDLATSPLSDTWLYDYGILVIVGKADYGTLDSTTSAVLEDWVKAGGRLLYNGYHPTSDTCAMVDSLPSSFGLACAGTSTYWGGEATNIVAHDVTDGVSSVWGAGGELWTVSAPAATVVDEGTWPVVAVAEVGDGRVVGVSDEWYLYDAGTGSADISAGDNEVLVENIWAWLHDPSL